MLEDKLNKIRATKTDLFVLQKRFFGELADRFPYIMRTDMAKIANKLEAELQTLLCASLKYGSIKIPLPSNHDGYSNNSSKTIVNVQRGERGMYYPRSERGHSDVFFLDMRYYMKDNGDMYTKYETQDYSPSSGRQSNTTTQHDELKVGFSELKNPEHSRRILPDKLDAFYKHLHEVMAYKPKFMCYTEEGYGNRDNTRMAREFKVGKAWFRILEKSMDFERYEKPDTEDMQHRYSNPANFQYKPSDDDMERLLDYGKRDFDADRHDKLKLFIDNYDAIKQRLEKEEALKKKAYETCKDFLKQIRVHTLPFKVLSELKK